MANFGLTRHTISRRQRLQKIQQQDDASSKQAPQTTLKQDIPPEPYSQGLLWVLMALVVPIMAAGSSTKVILFATSVLLGIKLWSTLGQPTPKPGTKNENSVGKFTMQQRLAYRIDYSFSVVPYVKALTLLLLTAGLILTSGIAIYLTSDDSLSESLWEATAGVGLDWTFVGDDDSSSYRVRMIGVLTNIGGLVVTALLLGIVSDAVSMYLDNLRKGSCRVVEENFTLIIGWSTKSIPIIEQIAKANISEGGGVVVVLAERQKEDMEVDVAAHDSKIAALGTRVVCRSGSPLSLADLRKVSLLHAKSVVVLATGAAEEQSDVRSIRTLLSLVSAMQEAAAKGAPPKALKITVEVCDAESAPLMLAVSREMVEPVIANSVIGRLLVHEARQPQVAMVWETLLGFDDNEFYFQNWPILEGLTFGEVLFRFKDAIPLGVRSARSRVLDLNPSDDLVIQKGDDILVLAEDDDSYYAEEASLLKIGPYLGEGTVAVENIDTETINEIDVDAQKPHQKLLIGWRFDILNIIKVLNKLSPPGSELHVFAEMPIPERQAFFAKHAQDEDYVNPTNLTIVHHEGAPRNKRDLERIGLHRFTSVIISMTSSQIDLGVEDRDSQTVTCLLLCHEILKSKDAKDVVVVGEIHDPRSRRILLDSNIANAVVATNDLVSKSLAMVSEDSSVNRVLEDLFNAGGNEVQVVPVCSFVRNGERLSFLELTKRARKSRNIVIGFRRTNSDLILNPQNKMAPMVWSTDDQLITLRPSKQGEDRK